MELLFMVFDVFANLRLYHQLLLFILFLVAFRYLRRPDNLPPGPWGFPVVGIIPRIGKESYVTFTKWAQQYGNVYSVRLGSKILVILNDLEVANDALVKQASHFSDRAAIPIVRMGLTIPGSLVFENGAIWQERRRWAMGALRNFGVGKQSIENKINEEARYVCLEIESKQTSSFDPYTIFNNAVSNVICSISFGERFEYSDPKFRLLLTHLNTFFTSVSQVSLANFFPLLWYTPLYRKQKKVIKFVQKFVKDIVRQHQLTFDPEDIRDIVDANIEEVNRRQKEDADIIFDAKHIWRSVQDLFQAGSETATSTISWIVFYMLHYPHVQTKAQKEIEEIIGRDRVPSWSDRHQMPYVEAMIMEVQRIANVSHSSVPRCTNAEVKLKGYTIPANTQILLNIWSIHNDPKYWKEPSKFDPMRFIADDGKLRVKNDAFIPYGLGRRVCLGENLAKMELFLFITNFLQHFTFKVPDGECAPPMDVKIGINRMIKPFNVVVSKR